MPVSGVTPVITPLSFLNTFVHSLWKTTRYSMGAIKSMSSRQ